MYTCTNNIKENITKLFGRTSANGRRAKLGLVLKSLYPRLQIFYSSYVFLKLGRLSPKNKVLAYERICTTFSFLVILISILIIMVVMAVKMIHGLKELRAPRLPAGRSAVQNSHFEFTRVDANSIESLTSILHCMGYTVETNSTIRGYQGSLIAAEIVVKRKNFYDFGFKLSGGSFCFITDPDFWREKETIPEFLEKINTQFSEGHLMTSEECVDYRLVE